MFDQELIFRVLGLTVVGAPAALFCVLGLSSLLRDRPLGERTIVGFVEVAIFAGLLASISILALMLGLGVRHVPITFQPWVDINQTDLHYHFVFKFEFDRLSVPFVILTFVLCGTISAFCSRYMHREQGFNRFFVFYSLFVLGMVMTSLAGTIETLFTGWELVGLSSALLVAFYHGRLSPVQNGLRVWCVYRLSDAALLLAAVVLHHLKGEGDFDHLVRVGHWPEGTAVLTEPQCLAVGLLLLVAAMGKSAMVPFSGWLPRAMEGPTPSSAVFYGALSVHLGAFLLLRVSPLLDQSPTLRVIIVMAGLATAVFGTFAARVQTDIKCALSFASLTQVGLIVAEIGLLYGSWRYIVLVHILGHACLRTLQFLRAPTLLHDYRILENAIGDRLPTRTTLLERRTSDTARLWLYRLALQRGYLDACLSDWIVAPILKFFRGCDALEQRWTKLLSGQATAADKVDDAAPATLEELL